MEQQRDQNQWIQQTKESDIQNTFKDLQNWKESKDGNVVPNNLPKFSRSISVKTTSHEYHEMEGLLKVVSNPPLREAMPPVEVRLTKLEIEGLPAREERKIEIRLSKSRTDEESPSDLRTNERHPELLKLKGDAFFRRGNFKFHLYPNRSLMIRQKRNGGLFEGFRSRRAPHAGSGQSSCMFL